MRKNQAMAASRSRVLALDGVVALRPGRPAQVFGAARSADRAPLYESRPAARRPAGPRTGRLPGPARPRPRAAGRPPTPSWCPGIDAGGPVTDGTRRPAVADGAAGRRTRGAPGSSPSARAPRCWPPPACSTAARPPPTGPGPTGSAGSTRGQVGPRRAVRRRRRRPHLGRGRRRDRPVPAHRPQRPRQQVANRAARRCVVPPWRDGGQAQYIERPVPAAAEPAPRRPGPGRWTGWPSRSAWTRWPGTPG